MAETSPGPGPTIAALRASSDPWRSLPVKDRLRLLSGWAQRFSLSSAELTTLAGGSGLSPEVARWGTMTTVGSLADGLADLVKPALRRTAMALAPEVCAHVWASTLPTSGWVPVVASLAVGSAVLIRAPAATLGAAEVLVASLRRAIPELGSAIEAMTWVSGGARDREMVEHVDALVVSGGAAAISRFARLVAARSPWPVPYLPFGPGYSVAVVPERVELDPRLMARMALDVAAYDQQGCLSPQAIWLASGVDADRFCRGLADALSAVQATYPRGVLSVEVAASIAQQVGTTRVLGQVYEADGGTVLWQPRPLTRVNPLHRTIVVHPYEGGPAGLVRAIERATPGVRIHSAAVAGGVDVRRAHLAVLAGLGASRVCRPGLMQIPPATWHHDGLSWVEALLRYADLR